MKIFRRPMPATIIFGLLCGASLVPLTVGLSSVLPWPTAFRLTIWSYLALYGFLLTRWGRVRFVSVLFPLLIVFLFAVWGHSATPFLFLALGVLSWIRSGICFKGPFPGMLGSELVMSLGGGALVTHFSPYSPATWAMAVWMFFLIQSLYFVFVKHAEDDAVDVSLDPFESARRQAEEILSTESP